MIPTTADLWNILRFLGYLWLAFCAVITVYGAIHLIGTEVERILRRHAVRRYLRKVCR